MTAELGDTQRARDRICNAALQAFASRGYDAVSMAEVGTVAGVSQPNVHYHFKSKRVLWEAAMRQLAVSVASDMATQRQMSSVLGPLEKLKVACALLIERSAEAPMLGQVILSEGQAGGERLDWLMRNAFAETYYEFLELIEACIAQGLIKPYKPSHILMLLHGAAVTQFNVAPLVDAVFGANPCAAKEAEAFKTLFMDVIFSGLVSGANSASRSVSNLKQSGRPDQDEMSIMDTKED